MFVTTAHLIDVCKIMEWIIASLMYALRLMAYYTVHNMASLEVGARTQIYWSRLMIGLCLYRTNIML